MPATPAAAAARAQTREGVSHARAGRTACAIAAYQRALSFDPTHMPAHVNLASLLLHVGRPSAALAACERGRALDQEARHPYLLLVSGMARADLGEAEAAEADLLRYQESAPDSRFTRAVWRALRALERPSETLRAA